MAIILIPIIILILVIIFILAVIFRFMIMLAISDDTYVGDYRIHGHSLFRILIFPNKVERAHILL